MALVGAGVLEQEARRGVRQERQRRQRIAELLQEDDQLDHAESLAALYAAEPEDRR